MYSSNGNRLSTFDPLKPDIIKANILSQFPQDTLKVPIPEKTTSEVELEKAGTDIKGRKELAIKNEALNDGSFPIRNRKDLEKAIHGVETSKNPGHAKNWIKKRAKDLDCEDCLPGSWEKGLENELEKGGPGSGRKLYDFHGTSGGKLKKLKNYFKENSIKHGASTFPGGTIRRVHVALDSNQHKAALKHIEENKLGAEHEEKNFHDLNESGHKFFNVSPEELKNRKSIKKSEECNKIDKAFENIFDTKGNADPIEKAFGKLIDISTDPIDKAFDNLMKGGPGSGRKFSHNQVSNAVAIHNGGNVKHALSSTAGLSDLPGKKKNADHKQYKWDEIESHFAGNNWHPKHIQNVHSELHSTIKTKKKEKKQLKDQNSYLDARYANHHTD